MAVTNREMTPNLSANQGQVETEKGWQNALNNIVIRQAGRPLQQRYCTTEELPRPHNDCQWNNERPHDSPQASSAKERVPATLYDWTKNLNNTELQIWKPPLHKMKNRNETTIGQRDEKKKKDDTIKDNQMLKR